MRLGAKGEALIKSFEHLEFVVYTDERGIPTGGWGHTGFYSPGVPMAIGQTLAEAQAENWFSLDTSAAVNGVIRCLDVAVNQNQFDALVSFAFNVGVHALAHSTLLRDLNEGRTQDAANEFLKWDYCAGKESEGLENRRKAERDLFLTPVTA